MLYTHIHTYLTLVCDFEFYKMKYRLEYMNWRAQ